MMLAITFAYSAVLILFGGFLYAIAEHKSLTAFIPGFFGIVVATLAAIAFYEPARKHIMHVIVGLSLIVALAGLGMGFSQLTAEDLNFRKIFGMLGMGVIAGVYVALAIRSFIDARRSRREREAGGPPPAA